MRDLAAQEGRMQHAGQFDIVDEQRLAGQQPAVLIALDRRAEISRAHGAACPHRCGRRHHRIDDVLIAGAAAEIAGQRLAHFVFRSATDSPSERPSSSSGCPACNSRIAGRDARASPAAADAARRPLARGLRRSRARGRWPAPRASGRSGPAAPSSRMVQAPHTPCSQPTWVPASRSSWRRKSLSSMRESTERR